MLIANPPHNRFWQKVIKTETCWIWTGCISTTGYGQFKYNRHRYPAHRFAYEEINGPIPTGLILDHLCRIRHCVNPSHLEAVTRRENIMRGISFTAKNAKATHCKHGHFYTPENTYIEIRTIRICKICRRNQANAHYQHLK